MQFDVIIVGGGPAGLAAALALGRARRRVLLCDAGPRRNAAAANVYNFVTRDGTPPAEFRRIGAEQLHKYPSVEVRAVGVASLQGERGRFVVRLTEGEVTGRRILLCTGMVDLLPDIEGFAALWGTSIFQCPYCHGWEVQDRRFGVLATNEHMLDFAIVLRAWTEKVVVLTNAGPAVSPEARARLARANVDIDERPIARFASRDGHLDHVAFRDGAPVPLDVLFAKPAQSQVPLVSALGLTLDKAGFVQVSEMFRETSIEGIHAGGDLLTQAQGAIMAAASGTQAAAALNFALMAELAELGALAP